MMKKRSEHKKKGRVANSIPHIPQLPPPSYPPHASPPLNMTSESRCFDNIASDTIDVMREPITVAVNIEGHQCCVRVDSSALSFLHSGVHRKLGRNKEKNELVLMSIHGESEKEKWARLCGAEEDSFAIISVFCESPLPSSVCDNEGLCTVRDVVIVCLVFRAAILSSSLHVPLGVANAPAFVRALAAVVEQRIPDAARPQILSMVAAPEFADAMIETGALHVTERTDAKLYTLHPEDMRAPTLRALTNTELVAYAVGMKPNHVAWGVVYRAVDDLVADLEDNDYDYNASGFLVDVDNNEHLYRVDEHGGEPRLAQLPPGIDLVFPDEHDEVAHRAMMEEFGAHIDSFVAAFAVENALAHTDNEGEQVRAWYRKRPPGCVAVAVVPEHDAASGTTKRVPVGCISRRMWQNNTSIGCTYVEPSMRNKGIVSFMFTEMIKRVARSGGARTQPFVSIYIQPSSAPVFEKKFPAFRETCDFACLRMRMC